MKLSRIRNGSERSKLKVEARKNYGKQSSSLAGPEPAENAGGKKCKDYSIERFLENIAPGIAFPNSVAEYAYAVSEEGGGADDAKNMSIRCKGSYRVAREISHYEAHE